MRSFLLIVFIVISSVQVLYCQYKYDQLLKLRFLKDTASLVIRIEDYKDAIDKYSEKGDTWTAKQLLKKAERYHKRTIDNFVDYYDFSKFYFYNSSDSDKLIKEGDLSVIYDADGNPATVNSLKNVVIGQCLEGNKRLKAFYRVIRFYNIENGHLIPIEFLTKREIKRSVWTILGDLFPFKEPMNDVFRLNSLLNGKFNGLEYQNRIK